jgi:hypothetical protein
MIERITVLPYQARRRFSMYLEISKETEDWLTGSELDKFGDRKDHVHLIDKSAITKRVPVSMDLHYGEFKPSK